MSDRLSELLRQRALLQEHLAWLDREIDATTHSTGAPVPATLPRPLPPLTPLPAAPALPVVSVTTIPAAPPVSVRPVRMVLAPTPAGVAPAADAILDKYRVEPRSVQQDVRKGCFLYFVAAFVVLGLGVTALYFMISSR